MFSVGPDHLLLKCVHELSFLSWSSTLLDEKIVSVMDNTPPESLSGLMGVTYNSSVDVFPLDFCEG